MAAALLGCSADPGDVVSSSQPLYGDLTTKDSTRTPPDFSVLTHADIGI
jgi:hypothetical protein